MRVNGLVHALQALEPYLGDVVICGGWAWYLYRKYLGDSAGIPAEFTRDLDCAVHEGMPVRGVSLRQRLNESAFECEYRGESVLPALLFSWPSSRRPQVEIEFIAHARGDGTATTVRIQEGVTAQALRHVDLLLRDPLTLTIDETDEMSGARFTGALRVPRVGHFLVQKAVVMPRRQSPSQRNKDAGYIFDVLDPAHGLAARALEDIGQLVAVPAEIARVISGTEEIARAFGDPERLNAVWQQIPVERRPPKRFLQEEVRRFLTEVRRRAGIVDAR